MKAEHWLILLSKECLVGEMALQIKTLVSPGDSFVSRANQFR